MTGRRFSMHTLLGILAGVFLLLSGIEGLRAATTGTQGVFRDFSQAMGGSRGTVEIIAAILSLAAGALLVVSQFASLGVLGPVLKIGVFLFWLAVIVTTFFLNGQVKGIDTLAWWLGLTQSCLLLVVLWIVKD